MEFFKSGAPSLYHAVKKSDIYLEPFRRESISKNTTLFVEQALAEPVGLLKFYKSGAQVQKFVSDFPPKGPN